MRLALDLRFTKPKLFEPLDAVARSEHARYEEDNSLIATAEGIKSVVGGTSLLIFL